MFREDLSLSFSIKQFCRFLALKHLILSIGKAFTSLESGDPKWPKPATITCYRYPRSFVLVVLILLLLGSLGCFSRHGNHESSQDKADLSEMVGQMLMVGFRGLEVSEGDPIVKAIKEVGIGGVVLYDRDVLLKRDIRNIAGPDQLAGLVQDLQSISKSPLFVTVDQEGGQVCRLKQEYGFPLTLSAAELGEIDRPERTKEAARQIGQTLNQVRINFDLAPVVDVNVNPQNPAIGMLDRSFSRDPEKVIAHAEAFIQGLHEEGILSCIKHFPGHGSAWNDSHFGLTNITKTWTRKELRPFAAIIEDNLCDAVMTGHLFNSGLDSEYPATLSSKILKGLLREELGFKGVIISDDMQMGAIYDYYGLEESVYRFLKASGDILLFANNLQYDPNIAVKVQGIIMDLIEQGRIEPYRIERSYNRIRALKARLSNENML